MSASQQLSMRAPDPRREQIARRLRERIGGSSEDFYRSGAAIVEGTVSLEAGYHIVGHCAREIESAVREVLVALLMTQSEQKTIGAQTRETKSTQRAEVEEIVRRLGLPADAPEVGLWLQLADARASAKTRGLHAIAHRQAHRHAPPIDDDIREMWRRFESLSEPSGHLAELVLAEQQRFCTIVMREDGLQSSSVTRGMQITSGQIREFPYATDAIDSVIASALMWVEPLIAQRRAELATEYKWRQNDAEK